MSSFTLPQWSTAPVALDQMEFRSWLHGVTQPGGPGFENGRQRVHRAIAPLMVQAELGRGCNRMVLDALAVGRDHLPERMNVVSERILDCLEFATDSNRNMVGDLSHRLITPIDAEDLFQLSRHFVGTIERLASVASNAALVSLAAPAIQPIHTAVAESFVLSTGMLYHLGDRERGHASYVELCRQQQRAKSLSRQYFTGLLAAADSVSKHFGAVTVRRSYNELIAHLGQTAGLLYRTTLKNG